MCSIKFFFLSAAALLVLAGPAFAAPKKYSTTVSGRLGQFVKPQLLKSGTKKSLALTIPATVSVVVPNYGKVKITFLQQPIMTGCCNPFGTIQICMKAVLTMMPIHITVMR